MSFFLNLSLNVKIPVVRVIYFEIATGNARLSYKGLGEA